MFSNLLLKIDLPKLMRSKLHLTLACLAYVAYVATGLLTAPPVAAQFALAVVPPRFELQAKPGQKLREVIELSNTERSAGRYTIKTNDWTLNADASVDRKSVV